MSQFIKDKYGVLGQIQPDGSIEGGDSACWQGHLVYLSDEEFAYVDFFEVSPGAYVRHPIPSATNNSFGSYYKNPWCGCMSRDQLTGVVGALVKQKEYMAMLRLIAHFYLRGFVLTYNTLPNGAPPAEMKFSLIRLFKPIKGERYWKLPDLFLFDMWATVLRGFGKASWIFFPLLCVLDIHTLLNTVLVVNRSDDNDKINYAMKLFVSRDYVPTPVSWLSLKLLNLERLLGNIQSYWCNWRQQPGMYPLYVERFKKLGKTL